MSFEMSFLRSSMSSFWKQAIYNSLLFPCSRLFVFIHRFFFRVLILFIDYVYVLVFFCFFCIFEILPSKAVALLALFHL